MVNHCQKTLSLLLLVILIGSKLWYSSHITSYIVHSFRHSKEMICRLENAGLGFYVKATKQIHKLGMWLSSSNTHYKVHISIILLVSTYLLHNSHGI